MEALTLIISIIALIIAIVAYERAGGIDDLKKQTEVFTKIGDSIVKATDSLRTKTADILGKMDIGGRRPEESKPKPRTRRKKEEDK
jgi:hypothetical protein